MFKLIKNILPNIVLRFLKDYIKINYNLSYSQEGEDMILNRLFQECRNGFYVDVGAHHPKRFSNTYFFYKKGWNGINIDAMPGSMKIFNTLRTRDINIEESIASEKKIMTYYMFNEPALNGFSKDLSELRSESAKNNYFIEKTLDIQTSTLEDVLEKNLPQNHIIDFLSIDVEGLDFDVLKSNNFDKYKPRVILIEILGANYNDVISSEITKFLSNYDYQPVSKSVRTLFFITSDFYKERFPKLSR
jgi:FkbM family methyltransferase